MAEHAVVSPFFDLQPIAPVLLFCLDPDERARSKYV